MKSRNIVAGLVVLASVFLMAGTASASAASPASSGECVIISLPEFTSQGEEGNEGTVADIVEVSCDPFKYGTGSKVKVTAYQLYLGCHDDLTWYVPNPYSEVTGSGVTLELDADGNAVVALRAGPHCSNVESFVTAHMETLPYESFTTVFHVEPPRPTPAGVTAIPARQIEDASSSAVATIVEAEFPGISEEPVHIASEELYHRCRLEPHLHWVLENGETTENTPEVNGVELDNDGNAFVIAIGDHSCAEGASLIEGDLEVQPFTSPEPTTFTIEPPQVRPEV
jgi:hypothetical protein